MLRNILRFFYYFKHLYINKNLNRIFDYYLSDKSSNHYKMYSILETLLKPNKAKKILEIGAGGHNLNNKGGASLFSLKRFYNKADIVCLDIEDKPHLKKNFIFFQGSQDDEEVLKKIVRGYNKFDLIIDDGSHFGIHQVKTFNFLFNYLSDNGIYIIEDTNGAFTERFYGSSKLDTNKNIISYLSNKSLSSYSHAILKEKEEELKLLKNIEMTLFFENSVLIKKGKKIKKINDYELTESLEQYNIRFQKENNAIKKNNGTIDLKKSISD